MSKFYTNCKDSKSLVSLDSVVLLVTFHKCLDICGEQ